MVKLGNEEYFKIESGGTPDSQNQDYWNGDIRWATLVDLPAEDFISEIKDTKRKISVAGLKNSSAKLLPKDSILVSSRATIGRIAINKVELATNQGFKNIIIKNHNLVDPNYVAMMMTILIKKREILASGGTFKEISKTNFSTLEIPLPNIKEQRAIVASFREEQKQIAKAEALIQQRKEKIK